MSYSRNDPRVRLAARLTATLAATPDEGLERFRARRAGDLRVQPDDLELARDVIDAVGFALAGTDRANWQRLRQAWEVVRRNTPPDAADTPEDGPARAAPAPSVARSPLPAAGPPELPAAVSPELAPAVPPGLAPAVPPGLAPAVPPGLATAVPPELPAAVPPGLAPAVADAGGSRRANVVQPAARGGTVEPAKVARPEALGGVEPPAPGAGARAGDVDATQGVDVAWLAKEILPFSGEVEAAERSTIAAPHPDAGATSFAVPVVAVDPLPFEGRPTSDAAPAREDTDLDGTREVDALVLDADALPFAARPAPGPAVSSPLPVEPHPEAGATSYAMPAVRGEDEVPFAGSATTVELTLAQYASFMVELERTTDRRGLQRRYGIADDAAARRVVSAWRERLAADPALAAELARLTAAYRAWLDEVRS